MKTLEIKLPDEIFGVLSTIAVQKDKFVADAIREKLEREKAKNLKQILTDGYKATAREDLALTKDFETADLENL